jgi:hypothetical protein
MPASHFDVKPMTGRPKFIVRHSTIASMEFQAAIYMSFKKTQCSLSFIVINVIIINFEGTSK